MGIANTVAPKTNQQNYDDYISGPKTVTIQSWRELPGSAQPYELHLAEFPGKPYKPSKGMRRVLIRAWGENDDDYIGRRMTLFGNPDVMYAGEKAGGIQISHLSHIREPLLFSLTTSKGKRSEFKVQPLAATDPAQVEKAVAAIRNAATVPELDKIGAHAERVGISGEVRDAIDTRRAELEAPNQSNGSES